MRFLTAAESDPGSSWDVDGLGEEYWEARLAEGEPPPEQDTASWPAPPIALDDQLTAIDMMSIAMRAASAEHDELLYRLLERAADAPEPWVGPDPTLDPLWVDPRGRSTKSVRFERRMMGIRSAAADLGVRLHLSDNQVRHRAHRAEVLLTRMPRLWAQARLGLVPEQNTAYAAQLALTLPDDDREAWERLDGMLEGAAVRLTPGRFRARARAARERAHSESLTARHARAAADRNISFTPALDSMTEVTALVPAVEADAIRRGIDSRATHLATADDESRTLEQLRADVFVDLLTRATDDTGTAVKATVHITIPIETVLGQSDEPATLAGYGPIPLPTALAFAGDAACWRRVLVDSFTGTVLDVERRAYRVPKDLRRLLTTRYPTCVFPGCTRPSEGCDMDHRQRWADGGHTSITNLFPECDPHHPVKDESLWSLIRDPYTGRLRWITPTGAVADLDPPPF